MFGNLPPVTRGLILANVAVYLLQQMVGDPMILYLGLWPLSTASVYGGMPGFQPWQVITYGFLHGSVMHIFLNMFALYMFGGQLERLFGPKRFLNLYLASIITAGLSQLAYAAFTGARSLSDDRRLGRRVRLLLAFAMYFPRQTIVLLIPPIPMPAWLFVTLYGALELSSAYPDGGQAWRTSRTWAECSAPGC